MIDLVNSMDCCNLLEFPKLGYLLLKNKTTKPKYKQNTNTNFWKELLVVLKTFRTFHHSPCSTIIPSSKIDTLLPWVHCAMDCFYTFLRKEIYKPHSHNFSYLQQPKIKIKNHTSFLVFLLFIIHLNSLFITSQFLLSLSLHFIYFSPHISLCQSTSKNLIHKSLEAFPLGCKNCIPF